MSCVEPVISQPVRERQVTQHAVNVPLEATRCKVELRRVVSVRQVLLRQRFEQHSFRASCVWLAHFRQCPDRRHVRIAVQDSLQPTAARPCVSHVGQESFKLAAGNRFANVVRQERRIRWWAKLAAPFVYRDAIQRRQPLGAYCVDRERRAMPEMPIAPLVLWG